MSMPKRLPAAATKATCTATVTRPRPPTGSVRPSRIWTPKAATTPAPRPTTFSAVPWSSVRWSLTAPLSPNGRRAPSVPSGASSTVCDPTGRPNRLPVLIDRTRPTPGARYAGVRTTVRTGTETPRTVTVTSNRVSSATASARNVPAGTVTGTRRAAAVKVVETVPAAPRLTPSTRLCRGRGSSAARSCLPGGRQRHAADRRGREGVMGAALRSRCRPRRRRPAR